MAYNFNGFEDVFEDDPAAYAGLQEHEIGFHPRWDMMGIRDRNRYFGKFLRKIRQPTNEISKNSYGHFTTVDGVPVRKIFVTNLPNPIFEQDLFQLFSRWGAVLEAFVVKSAVGKPFAFVTFHTPAEATCVLKQKNHIFINNRKLFISPADSWHQPIELANGELVFSRRKQPIEVEENNAESVPDAEEAGLSHVVVVKPDDSCPISKLNDDCLLLIFEIIPLNQRLNLHQVCRRWHSVAMTMWNGQRKLDFTVPPLACDNLTDEILCSYIQFCPNITSINIADDDHHLTSNALVLIAKYCHNLEEITMRELKMKKRTLAFFAKNCPKLKAFYIDACPCAHDGEMIGLVKNCRNLERIGLKYSSSPSGHWLRFIQPPLKSLSLEMYDFDPDHLMMGIRNAKESIRELKFVSCSSIRSEDIEFFTKTIPNLTQLTLAGGFPDFQSHSLMPITKLKKLVRLDLDNNSHVSDQFLDELAVNCPHLQTFTLSGIDDRYLTNEGLSTLSKFTGLTYLTVACIRKLTDNILKSISLKIKGLKHLGVMGCSSITDIGCQNVVTNCKDLETFDVSGCRNVSDVTVIAAAESTRGTGRKLKLIVGNSGIDANMECPPSVILDCSSSIMSQLPGAMFILDPEFEMENEFFFNNLSARRWDNGMYVHRPQLMRVVAEVIRGLSYAIEEANILMILIHRILFSD